MIYMVEALTIRECWNAGYEHGWSLAHYNPMPKVGDVLETSVDWDNVIKVESVEEQLWVWQKILYSADDHSRQFSPFEFVAAAINARQERFGEFCSDGWDAFERGMQVAIETYRRKHYPIRKLRKEAKEIA